MNAFINVGILVSCILPLADMVKKAPNPAKQTQITLGVGGNPNSGGSIPHMAVWDENNNRVTQFTGDRNGHIGDKSGNTITFTKDNYQNHMNPANPEYVSIVMHENDGICLALVIASTQGIAWSWTGDIGYTCGAQWYASKYTVQSSNQPIRCVWLDANHDNGIIAKGLTLHTRDFSGEAGLLAQYKEDQARLCQNTARMTFHPDIAPDSLLPAFFQPALSYMGETNDGDPTKPYTAGALKKPDQGKDRKTRAYPDGTNLDGHKLRMRRNIHGRRSVKRRGIKNLDPSVLTVSHLPGHSARELCEHDMSLGPDFVSMEEGLFCDMETATLWSLCDAKLQVGCFDMTTKTIKPRAGKRDGIPEKTYTSTDEWKKGVTGT